MVHITDEKNTASILRSGIRIRRKNRGIYFMPVLQSHFISHQWIRELRRGGAKVLVGVYFRLPSSEQVWAGLYNQPHRSIVLGEAIREIRALKDPLGYEIFINRSIVRSEIHKVRAVPQGVGWRYMPHAHGRPLCGCPACMPKGLIKSRRLRERLEPTKPLLSLNEVKARLLLERDEDEIMFLFWALRKKRRRMDPKFLEPLMNSISASVREDAALTLPYIRHPDSKRLLRLLINDDDPNVAGAAKDGLRRLGAGD